jgi:capsid protein
MLEAWKFFISRRAWLAANFNQPVYEVFLYEAILLGRLSAPGYFRYPEIRKAYSTAEWVGPAAGQIDPLKEVNAAEKRIASRLTTIAQETAALGGDWDKNYPQIRKEQQQLKDAGLIQNEPAPAPSQKVSPDNPDNDPDDPDKPEKEDDLETA